MNQTKQAKQTNPTKGTNEALSSENPRVPLLVETRDLTKFHGPRARIHGLCMQVPSQCVYGFLGPNGAGKTTTLKCLLGLIRPSSGRVFLFGQEIQEKNRLTLLRRTGSLIESPSYYGHLTGLENLQIVARLKGVPFEEIDGVLRTVRLSSQRDKKVRHYSLGMKQRLGIAMALLGEPELLILDEPTNGLDPAGIQEIRQLIRSLPSARHMTVILSSHLLSEVSQMADYVGIINRGEMVFQGSLDALESRGGDLEEIFLSLTGGADSL